MGLDQEILAKERDVFPEDHYEQILQKRKCYPLHTFIKKWLMDEYKLTLEQWEEGPFGPYIRLPSKTIQRFCTALKKRNRGGGYRSYKIWSRPGRKLKVAVRCPKTIPPLVRQGLENRLAPDLLKMVGSYVGGECKYDRMFGVLDYAESTPYYGPMFNLLYEVRMGQDAWDSYPNKEQEEDVEALGAALESGRFDNQELYYYASW